MATSTIFSLLIFSTILSAFGCLAGHTAPWRPAATIRELNISAVFALGDSTIDSGNNNGMLTLTKANHPPYGCDFLGEEPTGRFSNGLLITDYVVSYLGIKDRLPAYLSPSLTEQDLLGGVCFASAGSGLNDLTAISLGALTIGDQVDYFAEYLERLKRIVGSEAAARKVADALFIISVGTNDITAFYSKLSLIRKGLSLSGYHDFLLQNIRSCVQKLHSMGGRMITVAGLPPVGCLPVSITLSGNLIDRVCVDEQNTEAKEYNSKLQNVLHDLKASLSGSRIAYADLYTPLMDMIDNPEQYGFTVTKRGCCGTGFLEVGPLCSPISPLCPNTSEFLFWDAIHPSQAAYKSLSDALIKTVLPKL